MDFQWTPTQAELYEKALRFAQKELGLGRTAPHAARPEFDRASWKACSDFGILGLCIGEEFNGMGLDALTTARVMEAVGRGAEEMGLVFAASAHLFACTVPVAEHGGEELRERFLPKMATGAAIAGNAITEAEAGSDVFAMKATAVRDLMAFVEELRCNALLQGDDRRKPPVHSVDSQDDRRLYFEHGVTRAAVPAFGPVSRDTVREPEFGGEANE